MKSNEKKDIPAIEAKNLTKTFGTLTAVDKLSLQVAKGEIFGIVGPDGAGKTTSLRMLASIMDPDSGTACIAGFDIRTDSFYAKENLAYMSQKFGLYPDLTVVENINFYADLYGVPRQNRAAVMAELLGFSQMQNFKQRKAGNLSGGMKQKLQLICALIHTPAVLLLDEPTNGVDPVSRRDFWKILYKIVRQGVAILVTTSYLDEAERCDRIGLLDQGKMLATGIVHDIKQSMDNKVLAIQSVDARKINKLLEKKLPSLNINVFGDMVHIVCQQIEQTERQALEFIQAAGLKINEIRQVLPSLEDIFVDMVSKTREPDNSLEAGLKEPSSLPQDCESKRSGVSEQTTDKTAVRVDKLTRVFGSFSAVDKISFQVPKGEIFGFLGPNGAGKSTTIRMLCGLLAPSSGKGVVAGYDIFTQAEQIKQQIGYMSQKFSLYEDLTVEENIHFYGGIYGLAGPAMGKRKKWAIQMAGLEQHAKTMTAVLSLGWKQRLALACAILHEPSILFLDEPTSGVDPISRRGFWDLIYDMADHGVTVFVTTHYMEEAEYCDRIALIYKGRMIAMGTPSELKTSQMHEHILDLRCDTSHKIAHELTGLAGVKDASLFGAGLHIVTTDPVLAEQKIRRKLDLLGIDQYRIEKITPGMEDVFISLIEADDKNEQTGKVKDLAP